VSLPFSDHVALLGDNAKALEQILSFLSEQVKARFCNYLEVRPTARLSSDTLRNGSNFCWHKLPLNREISDLYKSFHPSCIQRKIRRAERERLVYSEGTSEELIQQFYRLLVLTHRRHGVPPQPISWFRNLRDCLGNGIKFRVASKNGRAVASIVTLTHKKVMVYKYGCSDAKHHNLGGMIFLFWQAIQDAKSSGLDELDMGRSDWDNPGLITFKENWNAERHTLVYSVYPDASRPNLTGWRARAARGLFTIVPTVALPPLGRMLYRHFG
jgi:hypothetical protein